MAPDMGMTGRAVEAVRGLVYGPSGKQLDVHRPAGASGATPTVLLWHGIGPDERDVLEPLARATAAHGALVLVPDWRSDAPDGGRSHLLESLAFARKEAGGLGGHGESLVLAGWSAGAGAALGVALRPEIADEWRTNGGRRRWWAWPAATTCRRGPPGPRRWTISPRAGTRASRSTWCTAPATPSWTPGTPATSRRRCGRRAGR
ncbi:hypothetical protein OG229_22770 [Streptomyces platensis]|uniref:hypothetical protein n=1 Tax=Streptomyces platensis TaxID=58346 RepID=UPI002E14496E|nr:hypothetical protein OG229_22770 [Streptomyces platensis]